MAQSGFTLNTKEHLKMQLVLQGNKDNHHHYLLWECPHGFQMWSQCFVGLFPVWPLSQRAGQSQLSCQLFWGHSTPSHPPSAPTTPLKSPQSSPLEPCLFPPGWKHKIVKTVGREAETVRCKHAHKKVRLSPITSRLSVTRSFSSSLILRWFQWRKNDKNKRQSLPLFLFSFWILDTYKYYV